MAGRERDRGRGVDSMSARWRPTAVERYGAPMERAAEAGHGQRLPHLQAPQPLAQPQWRPPFQGSDGAAAGRGLADDAALRRKLLDPAIGLDALRASAAAAAGSGGFAQVHRSAPRLRGGYRESSSSMAGDRRSVSDTPSRGLARSQSVTERLDVRFRGAELFQRGGPQDDDDDDMSVDEVLRHFARRQRSSGGMRRIWVAMFEEDPRFSFEFAVGASGAVAAGTAGGVCGLVFGAATGTGCGIVLTPLTFGLSIPIGAVAGGAVGAGIGVVAGGAIGGGAGCTVGNVIYDRHTEVLDRFEQARLYLRAVAARAGTGALDTVLLGKDAAAHAFDRARDSGLSTTAAAGAVVSKAGTHALDVGCKVAADRRVRVAAASAAGGAAACSVSGSAMGLLVGMSSGAAWGTVPALLTFGLSIPVCAMVGGAAGACTGAAVGSGVGLVGGGLAGFGGACLLPASEQKADQKLDLESSVVVEEVHEEPAPAA